MTSIDSIVARLLALHPKLIDLSLDRMWRILDALGHPGAAPAAGDPRRRHQRQGLDHRLHARDPGGGGPARARLHLAASGALQRALPAGAGRRRRAGVGRGTRRGADGMRARQRRRADHRVRDRDRGGVRAVRAPSGRRAAARSRPRRPARRDQRGRAPARHRRSRRCRSIMPRFLGDTIEKIAAEKAGILKRGVPAIVAAQPREALAGDRAAGRARRRADQDRRRGLDRDRGARPAGLSGRRRACSICRRRNSTAAISSRMPASPSRRCARPRP